MAWIKARVTDDGDTRSVAYYTTPPAAPLTAANREEPKVLAGSWHDASLGSVSFGVYVETDSPPSSHIEGHHQGRQSHNLKALRPISSAELMPNLARVTSTPPPADEASLDFSSGRGLPAPPRTRLPPIGLDREDRALQGFGLRGFSQSHD